MQRIARSSSLKRATLSSTQASILLWGHACVVSSLMFAREICAQTMHDVISVKLELSAVQSADTTNSLPPFAES